jgi:hypothetical protein
MNAQIRLLQLSEDSGHHACVAGAGQVNGLLFGENSASDHFPLHGLPLCANNGRTCESG